MDYHELEKLFKKHGFQDYQWIRGENIVVKQWVRFKCRFMCDTYGEKSICPPNMPSIAECKEFFNEFSSAVILREARVSEILEKDFNRDEDYNEFVEIDAKLIDLERDIFLSGYYKVMALPMALCHICDDCSKERLTCRHKKRARPTPEALGVDVFETVRRVGYPCEVLKDHKQEMNRYAIILID